MLPMHNLIMHQIVGKIGSCCVKMLQNVLHSLSPSKRLTLLQPLRDCKSKYQAEIGFHLSSPVLFEVIKVFPQGNCNEHTIGG